MSIPELISWYLSHGFDVDAVRMMFPSFFDYHPMPKHTGLDWIRQWEDCGGELTHDTKGYDFSPDF